MAKTKKLILIKLSDEQRAQLDAWLLGEKVTYDVARERLKEKFAFTIGIRALSEYYREELFDLQFKQEADFAERAAAAAAASPDKFDEATIALIKRKAFERAVAEGGDIKELALLAGILGEVARLKLKRDELALSLERFRQQVKTDVEKGLDALFAEIKGRPEAEALFGRLKASVLKSVGGET